MSEWLDEHESACAVCSETQPRFFDTTAMTACGFIWGSGKTKGRRYRKMRHAKGRGGYLWVQVKEDGKYSKLCVHRTIARVFGAAGDGDQIRHLDGDPTNNDIHNLRFGTAKENADDRERHGRTARGEKNGWSRHSNEQVRQALSMLKGGATQREVAAAFGCSQSTIWRWSHGIRRNQ